MSAPTFLGIDGGGSHTRAFLTDALGRLAAWGLAGLSNPNHANEEERQSNLGQAIREACEAGGVNLESCVSVFVGMAGVTTDDARDLIRDEIVALGFRRTTISVDHDIRIALAGGLAGKPGIALIVGTGSSCYGRTADGRFWQTGGWEALISDEGSAYYVGREAMSVAVKMADGRAAETPLREAVFRWLGIDHVAKILPRIHEDGLARSEIAAFAPKVVQLAGEGDAAASNILNQGATLLAEMVEANHRMLPTGPNPDVVITGGLGTAETLYRARIQRAIEERLPSVKIYAPILPPAVGAAMLAMEQADCPLSDQLIARWKKFTQPSAPSRPG